MTASILVSFLLAWPVGSAAETGAIGDMSDSGGDPVGASETTRLVPRWTTPRRALLRDSTPATTSLPTPQLGKAIESEPAYAGDVATERASSEPSLPEPAMIDSASDARLVSPIRDENHRASDRRLERQADVTPSEEPGIGPERSGADAFGKTHWTNAARIVVHSPDSDGRLPSKLSQVLLDSGARSVENHEVELAVTSDHIRFYHPSDHMVAIEVAAELDGVLDSLHVKDFSFIRPQPPEGLVEIWLR